jgi:hypothetical protein
MFQFDLHEGEKLLKLQRQSEIVLAWPALVVMALIYVPAAFLLKYELFFEHKTLMFFWSFAMLLYFANKYMLWTLNCYLVTTKRVALVQYHSIFSKEVTEAPLGSIVNIKYSAHGILQSLLGLGHVEIKVAGLEDPLVFKNQRDPQKLKDYLWQLLEKSQQNPASEVQMESKRANTGPVEVHAEAKTRKIV